MYITKLNEWKKTARIAIYIDLFLLIIYILATTILIIFYNINCYASFYVVWFIVPPIFLIVSLSVTYSLCFFYIWPEARKNNEPYKEKKFSFKKYKISKSFIFLILNLPLAIIFLIPSSIYCLIKGVKENDQLNFIKNNNGSLSQSFNFFVEANKIQNYDNYFYLFYKENLINFFPNGINNDSFNNMVHYWKENTEDKNNFISELNKLNYIKIDNDSLYSNYEFSIKRTIEILNKLDYDVYSDPNNFIMGIFSSVYLGLDLIISIFCFLKRDELEIII